MPDVFLNCLQPYFLRQCHLLTGAHPLSVAGWTVNSREESGLFFPGLRLERRCHPGFLHRCSGSNSNHYSGKMKILPAETSSQYSQALYILILFVYLVNFESGSHCTVPDDLDWLSRSG